MTTLTGSTRQTLAATVDPPSFYVALPASVLQLGGLFYLWTTNSSAQDCLSNPWACLSDLPAADPWGRQVALTVVFALLMWAVSVINGHVLSSGSGTSDPSIVDRLWSILPVVYVWHWSASAGYTANPRLFVMACLCSVWGARLTWNFWRKGGFTGGEDHRWPEVRKWFPGWQFEVFNIVFVCLYQQLVILAFSVPAVAALQATGDAVQLQPLDYVATGLYAVLVACEHVADVQMFEFQSEKYRRKGKGEALGLVYGKGFIDTGLWAWSRHPNYFCEVSLWWAFYLFSVPATGGQWLNWTIAGPVCLTALFVPPNASLDTTESLSSRKYPGYADYQQRVARFVPWFPSAGKSD